MSDLFAGFGEGALSVAKVFLGYLAGAATVKFVVWWRDRRRAQR